MLIIRPGNLIRQLYNGWPNLVTTQSFTRCRSLSGVSEKFTSKPRDENTASQETSEEGRPDVLYRYLWLKCQSHENATLDSYETFVLLAAKHLGITHVQTCEPFRLIKRRTLLASRFVHKKYRVQYEHRTYLRHIQFKNLTGSTADTFLEYVERNLPEGVLLVAERHRLADLPFDSQMEESIFQNEVSR